MGQARGLERCEERTLEAVEPPGGVVVPLFRGTRQADGPARAFASDRIRKAEVARRLEVHPRTVERWVKDEQLPAEKPFGVRGPVRFFWPHVDAWWRARCAAAAG